MPESRNRKKDDFTPPPTKSVGPAKTSKRWVVPVMLTAFLLGLLWIVVFYIAGNQIPGMSALGNWNLLIGMGLIAIGFITSTQWE